MTTALEELIDLLDIESLEVNLFRGVSPEEDKQRVFGGQVAAQALVAAGRTVAPDRAVHSLHSYFLRPGDTSVPIIFEVDRIRDGRSFTTRRVVAIQHGEVIFNLSASFQIHETGPEHSDTMPMVPSPETLPTWAERMTQYADRFGSDFAQWVVRERPIDSRPVELPAWLDPTPREPAQDVWIKANGLLPDDPLLHACVVAYASDLTLLDTAMLPHGQEMARAEFQIASIDHAMWFHRPFRADEWLLYHQQSPFAGNSRGLAEGAIYSANGQRSVTVMQEGLMRPTVHRDAP
jgi:acyl-CoA thioesterase-2